MPVTQREQDIMELESQLRIQRIFTEWKNGFLGDRIPQQEVKDGETPNQTQTNIAASGQQT